MISTFQRTYPPALPASEVAYWFVFRGNELLMQENGQGFELIQTDIVGITSIQPRDILYIGTIAGVSCMACEVNVEQTVPQGWRALFGQLDDATYSAAGYAFQLLNWQRTSRYCPVCGTLNRAASLAHRLKYKKASTSNATKSFS